MLYHLRTLDIKAASTLAMRQGHRHKLKSSRTPL
jgi:hypothetical protein